MKALFSTTALLLLHFAASASPAWELKKNQDSIKVYTANADNSNVKSVRVECIINATPSQLTALLLDAKAHEQWVYSTKRSYAIRSTGPGSQLYYSEISMPWPLANREVVVNFSVSQQPVTKVLTVKAIAINGELEPKNDKVRVVRSNVIWTVTPLAPNRLKIEYIADADPGGSVPAWITNMFLTKGPYETFKQLRQEVTKPAYQKAHFDFIAD
ncbi:MAG: hypothetical protein BGO70_07270 [Bacteroidetes bacterium 43-93]|nr:lipid-binding protein [Bacteroidota bacterium]OJW97580.1 MAG: hypothetical protein BGO70_07270 [Bacteroidetes bacterium 43-93]